MANTTIDNFIRKFSGYTDEYRFYNDEVVLRYDKKNHVYLLLQEDGTLTPVDGVTDTVHIIDKSDSLVPWSAKMMAQKLFATVEPFRVYGTPEIEVACPLYFPTREQFERWVLDGKSAHSDHLEEAGNIGHIAHNWIEQYIKAVLKDNDARKLELLAKLPDEPKAANCCTAALDWMQRHNVRWISTERKVFSREYVYAGTMDGLCSVDSCGDSACCQTEFKDRLTIADWKTSNYLYIEYVLQTAAYQHAVEEETGEFVQDRWLIRLGKEDAEFDPWHLERWDTYERDFAGFLATLNLSRLVRQIKGRIEAIHDTRKAHERAAEKAKKEAALRIKCAKADKFQGTRYPKCNGSDPCEACLAKFKERHPDADENALTNVTE
jgi:hypothetical protein